MKNINDHDFQTNHSDLLYKKKKKPQTKISHEKKAKKQRRHRLFVAFRRMDANTHTDVVARIGDAVQRLVAKIRRAFVAFDNRAIDRSANITVSIITNDMLLGVYHRSSSRQGQDCSPTKNVSLVLKIQLEHATPTNQPNQRNERTNDERRRPMYTRRSTTW
jgi:hypothetical protein